MNRRRPNLTIPVAIGLAGIALSAVIGLAGGVSASDAFQLLSYSVAGAAATGVVATVALRAVTRKSITAQTVVAAMAPVLAVAVGVTWAAEEMFLMSHDVVTLGIVLVTAGSVAAIIAVTLGQQVTRSSEHIVDMARRLDGGQPLSPNGPHPGPGEFATLARELQTTSARLAEARRHADDVERSRRELVAWVSHDLRTPLAGIRAMVEAIEDGVVTDAATIARYHATIRIQTQRLSELVDDLFELSRIQAGSLRLGTEIVPLDELVIELVGAYQVSAAPVRLVTTASPGAPVVALSPPEMLRVLRNLIDNAVRHTPPDGTVTIETGAGTGTAWISITDSCGGIPEADLPRLFETGFRGDAARTPGDGGGGLGLAVAQGLVGAHGGHIDVVNTHDGCRFTVQLPTNIGPGADLTKSPAR